MRFYYLLLFITLYFPNSVYAQLDQYDFDVIKNTSLNNQNIAANCFAQDSLGMIWIGTNNGLYNYDGYTTKNALVSDPKFKTFVYAVLTLDASHLAVGTGNGLFIYNYRNDTYEVITRMEQKDVRCLLRDGDKIWVGTLNGLYIYDIKSKEALHYSNIIHLDNIKIYSLQKLGTKLFLGTYNGFLEFDLLSNQVTKMDLPDYGIESNEFVNALYLQDKTLWIGTEKGVYSYRSGQLLKVSSIGNVTIKSLEAYGQKSLLLGTDNGLFLYNTDIQSFDRITHDSRNPHTLANNVVWRTFVDKDANIWIGTEVGFSFWRPARKEKHYPIYAFTNSYDGNNFYNLYKDSFGWYWLGGDNGLIRTKHLNALKQDTRWYGVDHPTALLPHNRIRRIYEDKSNNLWIASDGGINLYNRKSQVFHSFDISDSTHMRNAKWAYDIVEDRNGNFWIATYLGGVFVVNKDKLLGKSTQLVADKSYTKQNGLLVDFANQILEDAQGKIWILSYHVGVVVIDPVSGKSTEVKDDGRSIKKASYMIQDKEGNIWIALTGEVLKINSSRVVTRIPLDLSSITQVTSLADVGKSIWVSTSNSIWTVDKSTLHVNILKYDLKVNAIYKDASQLQVLLGGNDGIISVDHTAGLDLYSSPRKIYITSIYVNNELMKEYNKGLRYSKSFTFDNEENNLRFDFSDLNYDEEDGTRYAYRFMKGVSESWIPMEVGDNKLILANLSSGNYTLQVSKINMKGDVLSTIQEFDIKIRYPWYANIWAKIIYSFLLLGFILWVINFFRVKNRLKLERHARKNIQEVTKLKLDFFTSISHDLKTPLSLILGPLSKIIHQTKDGVNRRDLELIQRNALKIHALVDEVGNFDKDTSQQTKQNNNIYSSVSLLALLTQIVESFRAVEKDAIIEIYNRSEKENIYLHTDIIKLESILTNIISNAFKYNVSNPKQIIFEIRTSSKGIEIAISDNGIGISAVDLPYIFSKFYRAVNSIVHQKEGTGVGLYIVKEYCDQLSWGINLASSLNKGSTFTLRIPQEAIQPSLAISATEKSIQNSNRKKILLVEDNIELSSFIVQVLDKEYTCVCSDNAVNALELLEKSALPDLIISDYMMPIINGLDFVKMVKKKKHIATIPIILLTAQNDKQIEFNSAALGVDSFITKPFDVEFLKTKITQLLSKQEQLREHISLQYIQEPKESLGSSADEKLLSRITTCIEENLDDSDFSVQKLSEILDIPSKQIYRKVKNIVGSTPVEYIRKIRLNNAALLLKKGNFSIAEVMYMVGFSNPSYFSKCFQQEFQLSPKQYVDALKHNDSKLE